MTTLAAAPHPAIPQVPWARLGWVAWRQHRTTLAGTVAALAAIGLYLIIDGLRMRSAYDAFHACTPIGSAGCQLAWERFRDEFGQSGLIDVVLMLLPGIVGAFAGAPVLARELETGTFRYAWTQGAGRMRWAAGILASGAVGVAVLIAAFGLLVSWHQQPLIAAGTVPRLRATVFPASGIAAPGWALAGFALGVLAGLLWRRVLPALASACAAWFALAFLVGGELRLRYLAPLTTSSLQLSNSDLTVGQWWTRDGLRVNDVQLNSALQAVGVRLDGSANDNVVHAGGSADPVQYLLDHGYQQVTSYQPGSRYWTFQWIEFGWLAAFTAVLIGVAFWLLRRRAS